MKRPQKRSDGFSVVLSIDRMATAGESSRYAAGYGGAKHVSGSVFLSGTGNPGLKKAASPYAGEPHLLNEIDARLESLRAELAAYDPSLLASMRPATAPAATAPTAKVKAGHVHFPSFQTRQTRAAATARAAAAKMGKQASAGNGVVYRGKAAPRPRPPLPGQRPLGYLLLSKYQSHPAYTFAQKIILSPDNDPMQPDSNPGPGAYETLKY